MPGAMRDLFDISGKLALVTGGSRGIGYMITQGFVENGATVYISSRKVDVCDKAAHALSAWGTCHSISADIGTAAGRANLVSALKDREGRLDVLVNNAGASWGNAA